MPYYDEDFYFFNEEILPYKKWLACKNQKNSVEKKYTKYLFTQVKKEIKPHLLYRICRLARI
jgi:hypothetical protein